MKSNPKKGRLFYKFNHISRFKFEYNEIKGKNYSWRVLSLSSWDRWQTMSNSTAKVNIDVFWPNSLSKYYLTSFGNILKSPNGKRKNLWNVICSLIFAVFGLETREIWLNSWNKRPDFMPDLTSIVDDFNRANKELIKI